MKKAGMAEGETERPYLWKQGMVWWWGCFSM